MMRFVLPVVVLSAVAAAADPDWPQFGGPNRNFMVSAPPLKDSWPSSGPKQLWKRPLGEGYSSIAVDSSTLYTMYRKGTQEVVIALDAATGKTRWEQVSDTGPKPGMGLENGPGPHSTPLIAGDRVFTVGIMADLRAFDKKTGQRLWRKDLYKDFPGSTFLDRGYSCSPLAYKDTLILQLGGPGHALIALKQSDGSLVWAKQDFVNSPNSPILINVSGETQLVAVFGELVAGFNPDNGGLLWSRPHRTDWGLNISMPVWGGDNVLFLSSAYSGGSRALRLTRANGKTTVTELWANRQMRVHHGTILRLGDYIYGSSGDFGPAPFTAVNVKTGEIAWKDRAFPKANFVYASGKLILLDEDGNLALATVDPKGLTVHSKAAVLESNSWTPPTLTGTKLYLRDRHSILSLDLE